MISVAVVDDEQAFRHTICDYLDRYGEQYGERFQVTCFSDGLDIADEYRSKWDIIFLDIKMEHMDGMAAARRIRTLDQSVVLVFITTLAQYAITGYEVQALDFVLKPLSYPQFELRMNKAVNAVKRQNRSKQIFLKKYSDLVRISTDDLLYVEVRGHSLYYVTESDVYEKRATIGDAEAELKGADFARCSQSYLVNLKRVDQISGDTAIIGSHRLGISRNRKKSFLEQFSEYLEASY